MSLWLHIPVPKSWLLILSRLVLGVFNALSLTSVAASLPSTPAKFFYVILTISQFHTMFWGSRTIPNTFALILFQFALSYWIKHNFNKLKNVSDGKKMIMILIPAIVIFRAELAPMSAVMVLCDMYKGKYQFVHAVYAAVISAVIAITCTLVLDSYFWQQNFLWPELQVFVFNGSNQLIQASTKEAASGGLSLSTHTLQITFRS
jgi:alpha-1,6-mannosyltransferase